MQSKARVSKAQTCVSKYKIINSIDNFHEFREFNFVRVCVWLIALITYKYLSKDYVVKVDIHEHIYLCMCLIRFTQARNMFI